MRAKIEGNEKIMKISKEKIERLTQHHGPGKGADQGIGPEGQNDEQEDRFAPATLHMLCETEGGRIADREAERCDIDRKLDRSPGIIPIDPLFEKGGVVIESELGRVPAHRR